jgi:hypothetical protein
MNTELEARVGNRTRRAQEMKMSLAVLGLGIMFALDGRLFNEGEALWMLGVFVRPSLWAQVFTMIGMARLVVLIVNGFWPVGPTVRWVLCIISLFIVWMPIAVAYWMMLPMTLGYPALVLSVIAVIGELICLFALSALRAGRASGK